MYIFKTLLLVIVIIISRFELNYCVSEGGYDRGFISLTKELITHSDILIVTQKFPGTSPGSFSDLHQISFLQLTSSQNASGIQGHIDKLNSVDNFSVKILIYLSSIPDIVDVIRLIGTSEVFQKDRTQLCIIIIWPEDFPNGVNELEVEQKLTTNFGQDLLVNFTVDSELYIAFRSSQIIDPGNKPKDKEGTRGFTLYELYIVNNLVTFRQVESIQSTLNLCQNRKCPTQVQRRSDLKNATIACEGVEDPEIDDDTKFKTQNGQLILEDGFSFKILQLLQLKMNFSITITKTTEEYHLLADGKTFEGLVKNVGENKAEFGISSISLTPNRAQMVHFLPVTSINKVTGFFRNPSSINSIRDIFMQPFQPTLWAAVFVTWLILAFSMILFTIIRNRYDVQEFEKVDTTGEPEPDFTQDSLIWALATACQQGWDFHPSPGSLRTIFISGSFTGVVAYAGYSAAIVSTLSLRIDPIKTPNALIESNLRIGLRKGFLDDFELSTDNKDVLNQIIKRLSKKEDEREVNISVGYQNLNRNPYAFVSLKDDFYNSIKKDVKPEKICDIRELRLLAQKYPAAPILNKNSPYKEFLRHIILTIQERGVIWKLKDKYSYTRRCIQANDNQGKALGLPDVFTAFMILSGGYFLSFAFLLLEKLSFTSTKVMYIQ